MTLPGSQGRGRSFSTRFGGVDPEAVKAVLEAAATDRAEVDAGLQRLKNERDAILAEIARIQELEQSSVRVLVSAGDDASATRAAAQREAGTALSEAEARSALLLRDVEQERDRLLQELTAAIGRRQHALRTLEELIADLGAGRHRAAAEDTAAPPPLAAIDPAVEVAAPTRATTEQAGPTDAWLESLEDRLRTAAREARESVPAPESAEDTAVDAPYPEAPTATTPEDGPPAAAASVAPPVALVSAGVGPLQALEERLRVSPALAEAEAAPAGHGQVPAAEEAPIADAGTGPRWTGRRTVAAAAVVIVAAIAALAIPAITRRQTATPSDPRTEAPAARASLPADAAPPAMAAGQVAPPVPTTPPRVGMTVRLRTLRQCWVRVTVDGVSDERLIPAGEDIRLEARDQLLLRAGDAGALSIEINGQDLGPLGPDGQVANRRFETATWKAGAGR